MTRALDTHQFRDVFGRFATGVAVVTATDADQIGGMTANALCSLSLEPLLLLVCFENASRTLPLVRAGGRFAVSLLSSVQEPIARVFASNRIPESEKLERVSHRAEQGLPVIDGAIAWATCDLEETLVRGDHTIAIGSPTALGTATGDPLLWYTGRFNEPALRNG